MSGFRAYYEFGNKPQMPSLGDSIILDCDESRHLCGSLRAVAGDLVDAFDLDGNVYNCRIEQASPKHCALEILGRVQIRDAGAKVYLAQCLPKGKVFDEIIRQSVELGAAGILPIVSDHSIFRSDPEDMRKKEQKWRTRVIEAVKQSANFFEFKICDTVDTKKFFNDSKKFDLCLVASLESNSRPILDALEKSLTQAKSAENICILIGPEGDLSQNEYAQAAENNFIPVKLGDNVMKCDTAAACSLSILKAFFSAT